MLLDPVSESSHDFDMQFSESSHDNVYRFSQRHSRSTVFFNSVWVQLEYRFTGRKRPGPKGVPNPVDSVCIFMLSHENSSAYHHKADVYQACGPGFAVGAFYYIVGVLSRNRIKS